jgi:hypothetical protein
MANSANPKKARIIFENRDLNMGGIVSELDLSERLSFRV